MNNMLPQNFCTQQEVNNYLRNMAVQENDFAMIKTFLKEKNMKTPKSVVLHEKGITFADFIRWFEWHKYPSNFNQCCRVLGISKDFSLGVNQFSYKAKLLGDFQKLLICYDAYIKVSLFDIHKYESGVDHKIYTIVNVNGELKFSDTSQQKAILKFTNSEIRDEFYYNFEDLIFKCKELL